MGSFFFSSILPPAAVAVDVVAADKEETLRAAARIMAVAAGDGQDRLYTLFAERELQICTGIGDGVAVPHIKWDHPPMAGVMVLKDPVRFGALDGHPVKLFFLLAAPHGAAGDHLKVMARIARMAADEALVDRLKSCHDTREITDIIKAFEGDL